MDGHIQMYLFTDTSLHKWLQKQELRNSWDMALYPVHKLSCDAHKTAWSW